MYVILKDSRWTFKGDHDRLSVIFILKMHTVIFKKDELYMVGIVLILMKNPLNQQQILKSKVTKQKRNQTLRLHNDYGPT